MAVNTDEASLLCLLLISCSAAQLLTGQGQVSVRGPSVGDPWFLFLFLFLFLAVLGLRCCTRAFSSCGEWGLPFVAVSGLLIMVASLAAEHGL